VSTAVWVGTDKSDPIKNAQGRPVFGRMLPGSIWQTYMNAALRGVPADRFSPFVPLGVPPGAVNLDGSTDPSASDDSGDDSDENSDSDDDSDNKKKKRDSDDSDSSDGSSGSDGSDGSDGSGSSSDGSDGSSRGSSDDNAVFGRRFEVPGLGGNSGSSGQ